MRQKYEPDETLGDNAYPNGTLTQFNDCYVPGAAGYFDYFGMEQESNLYCE